MFKLFVFAAILTVAAAVYAPLAYSGYSHAYPYAYSGLTTGTYGYSGLGYAGHYGYSGLGYSAYPYAAARYLY